MELKYLNSSHKRKIVEFLSKYDNPKLTSTKHFVNFNVNDISEENYKELYQNIIDDYDYLKPNYEDSLDHIKNLEDVISQLYGVLEYIINSKGDIQEMEVEDIIPSIKSVFKEDEIIQLERNVKLDELVKNFTPCDKISRTTSPDIDITIGVNGKRKTKFTVTKLFYFFCLIISMICFSCCYILIYFNSFSFG